MDSEPINLDNMIMFLGGNKGDENFLYVAKEFKFCSSLQLIPYLFFTGTLNGKFNLYYIFVSL